MFTQSAYIRKSTPKLIKQLKMLGYDIVGLLYDSGGWLYTGVCNNAYIVRGKDTDDFLEDVRISPREIINCGTNEDLFLAIAALRNDSDFMQWFIWDKDTLISQKGGWMLCYHSTMRKDMLEQGYYHKASVKELIEHFKNKN